MMSNGFKISESDNSVYVKNTNNGYVIICLYVDDLLIMGSNDDIIQAIKRMLNNNFDLNKLGVANVMLGIKISKSSNGLISSQSHYIEKILKEIKSR